MSSLDSLISPLSIAPMIDWTNTHFRVLMRLLAPQALLYTEMLTPGAVANNPERALQYSPMEHPLALQLGGSDRNALVTAAIMAEQRGFVEINLNLGCPSDRVQAGRFGVCLMKEPDQVADCISAIKQAVSIPVTAKTRIGVDHEDSYAFFSSFAHRLIQAGCDKLVVHARKAWLNGLNPRQNRTVPPLHYDFAWQIKQELPAIPIVLNGNIETIDAISSHMQHVDGVMLGRLVCNNPYALAAVHHHFFPDHPVRKRSEIINDYFSYLVRPFENGTPLSVLLKPVLNFFHGMPSAKQWKELLLTAQQQKTIKPLETAQNLAEILEKHSH